MNRYYLHGRIGRLPASEPDTEANQQQQEAFQQTIGKIAPQRLIFRLESHSLSARDNPVEESRLRPEYDFSFSSNSSVGVFQPVLVLA